MATVIVLKLNRINKGIFMFTIVISVYEHILLFSKSCFYEFK